MSSACRNFSFSTSLEVSIEGSDSQLWIDDPLATQPKLIREKIERLRLYRCALVLPLVVEWPE